jgi:hypothetical protein
MSDHTYSHTIDKRMNTTKVELYTTIPALCQSFSQLRTNELNSIEAVTIINRKIECTLQYDITSKLNSPVRPILYSVMRTSANTSPPTFMHSARDKRPTRM